MNIDNFFNETADYLNSKLPDIGEHVCAEIAEYMALKAHRYGICMVQESYQDWKMELRRNIDRQQFRRPQCNQQEEA